MNTAVRDVQQSKQQLVVSLGRLARLAAPARLAAIVFAIAAFFAVAPRLYAKAAKLPGLEVAGIELGVRAFVE